MADLEDVAFRLEQDLRALAAHPETVSRFPHLACVFARLGAVLKNCAQTMQDDFEGDSQPLDADQWRKAVEQSLKDAIDTSSLPPVFDIPHDQTFYDRAKSILQIHRPCHPGMYILKPGDDLYLHFLKFMIDELRELDSPTLPGRAICMRDDAYLVLHQSVESLSEAWIDAAQDKKWYRSDMLENNFVGGQLEVFKNIIDAGSRQKGICYSIDLGTNGSLDGKRRATRNEIIIDRFDVIDDESGLRVSPHGKIIIDLFTGEIRLWLN